MEVLKHPLVLHTFLGFCLGIGFVIPALWMLGLFGIGGSLYVLQTYQSSWKLQWWTWFVKSVLVSSWIWNIYPIDWIGFDLGWIELPIIAVYWSTVSAAVACGGLVFYGLTTIAQKNLSQIWVGSLVPVIWVVAEVSSSFAFSIFLLGPGSVIGISFSMGYVGYLFGEHELLLQLASVWGVYGLSFVYGAIAVLLFWLYKNAHIYAVCVTTVVMIVSSSVSLNYAEPEGEVYKVVSVETTLPLADPDIPNQFNQLQQEILQAAKAIDPDYIIFPEDARVFDQTLESEMLRALLSFQNADTNAVIVDSGRVELDGGAVTQAIIYDGRTNNLYQSQKRYLVPQGEYLPYSYLILFKLLAGAETSTSLQERLAYRIGPDTSQKTYGAGIPSVLFCFEVVDPRGVRRVLSERETDSPFISHILSHAWIHHSPVFQKQLETMLRVQAIWNDTYIVSSANHAQAYTVTATGGILYPEIVAEGEYWQVGITEIPVK